MGKKSRNKIRLFRQGQIVELQKKGDRVEYEELIDKRRNEVEDILIERNRDFRKYNIKAKTKDIEKDKGIIKNKSFNELKNGFLNTSNKEKYIKMNKEHIKGLPINQQRNLIKHFLQYL